MAAGREIVFPGLSPIIGGARVLPSPSQFFLTGEDRLRIVCVNSQPGVVLKVQWRTARLDGSTLPNSETHTPTSDRAAYTEDYELGVGSLLNVTVFASAGTPKIGQTFVIAQLVRGVGAAAIVLGTILSGYVTAVQALGFPGSPIVSSTEGEPAVRTIVGADPAVDAEIAEVVPTGARWEILNAKAILTTTAAVANRRVTFNVTVAGASPLAILSADVQAANRATIYNWGEGLTMLSSASPDVMQQPLPIGLRLPASATIATTTFLRQAGDDWGPLVYVVREWLEVS